MSEICFNLWYYLNKQQCIIAIVAREYMLESSEEEIGETLVKLSMHDYKLLHASTLPQGAVLHFSEMNRFGVEAVYEREFERIRKALPKNITLPEDKFFNATPLFDFGEGFVPAEIGNGFIKERT